MAISFDEAKRKAEHELRFEIGNLPHLGEAKDLENKGYVFPIMYNNVELPDDPEEGSVTIYEARKIGRIIIEEDGTIDRTSNDELEKNILNVKDLVDEGEIEKI